MKDSGSFLSKGTPLKMRIQPLLDSFSKMPLAGQAGILGSVAVILVLTVSFFWTKQGPKQDPKTSKSKGERAKEMKQAFQSIEKRNGFSNGSADMKVGVLVLAPLDEHLLT